jgi:selenocysteine lyase/cysteine desulfurase
MSAAEHDFRELNFHRDARRYETGTMAYSLFHAWIAGLDLLREVGVDNISNRVLELTDRIIAGLRSKDIAIVSPLERKSERSAILAFTLGTEDSNRALHDHLKTNNILTALRDGHVRVSPNFFNTANEIDQFIDLL